MYRWGTVTGERTRMCTRHWWRWKRYGDAATVHPRFVPIGDDPPPRGRRRVQVSCMIPADFAGRVELAAVRAGVNRGAFLRRALEVAVAAAEAGPALSSGELRRSVTVDP